MATRKILKIGDELLRKMSKPVTKFDEGLWELLDDMRETMYKNDGAGLAAVQVGVLKRAIVMDINNMYLELINPEILEQSGEQIGREGCLSVGGIQEFVKRPKKVTVRAQDRYGYQITITGEDFLARCICHETDHLNGILFVDKIEKDYKEE
ncbi:MAG TPA: peptide deformylase [Candidatus Caccopulliclostridium gallistercoris]|uniref:Peptide deformylase n=1 Tax=Candidatus Caccopulliclostridium gallistercoris TaxID=2840719 RepID=A0A9D1SYH9_9FIRM|nr:peptide deformylase [Candidatus Caccopulliclostridium gallistercoris]